ncbi:MAG: VWA domain-containing protein [Acidobacteriota bacterium]
MRESATSPVNLFRSWIAEKVIRVVGKLALSLSAGLLIGSGIVVLPQNPPPDEVMRISTQLVVLDAQVVDRQSNLAIGDLQVSDFEVFENGVKQQISNWSRDTLPLSIVLLLDVSSSVLPYISQLSAGALEALQRLKAQDEVAILTFGHTYGGYVKVLQDFTKDRELTAERLGQIARLQDTGGGTNIPFALNEATKMMNGATYRVSQRTIVAVTDNQPAALGTLRKKDRDKLLENLFESNSVVCALTVGNPISPMEASAMLRGNPARVLAAVDFKVDPYTNATGGEAIVAGSDALHGKLALLFDRLRTRYSIGFASSRENLDGKFRKLNLKLTAGARRKYPEAVVRTRRGYYARSR